jgi:uncharacterized protein
MNDSIGSAHMTQGNSTTFTLDRFGNNNSALSLSGGWTQVPAGIYFDTPEFTISVCVYPKQIGSWSRVIDFANGQALQGIRFPFNIGGNDCFPSVVIEYTSNIRVDSPQQCALNQWNLLTATFDGRAMKIYINGSLTATNTLSSNIVMPRLTRTQNYVGKSNWNGDGYSYSFIDELRFYNKSLTQSQIFELMLLNDEINVNACRSTTTATSTSTISTTTITSSTTTSATTTTSSG